MSFTACWCALACGRTPTAGTSTLWLGTFALVNGGVSTALMALGARLTGEPLVFPSLGPTAFMLFYQPTSTAACPRNSVFGHLIGILMGYASLRIFGLEHATAAPTGGVTWRWIGVPYPIWRPVVPKAKQGATRHGGSPGRGPG